MPQAQVMRGDLDDVTAVGAGGDEIAGTTEGQTWTSSSRMKPSTEYTVTTTAEGPEGGATTDKSTFTTHDPEVTATYGIVYKPHRRRPHLPAARDGGHLYLAGADIWPN